MSTLVSVFASGAGTIALALAFLFLSVFLSAKRTITELKIEPFICIACVGLWFGAIGAACFLLAFNPQWLVK